MRELNKYTIETIIYALVITIWLGLLYYHWKSVGVYAKIFQFGVIGGWTVRRVERWWKRKADSEEWYRIETLIGSLILIGWLGLLCHVRISAGAYIPAAFFGGLDVFVVFRVGRWFFRGGR